MDKFETLQSHLGAPTDYFDFPSSLLAFSESLGSSKLLEMDGAFFRQRNKILTLITYFGSGERLTNTLRQLNKKGYKIKSLNFVNKDFTGLPTTRYMKEYYVDPSYSIEAVLAEVSKSTRYQTKRSLNKLPLIYEVVTAFTREEVLAVFYDWMEWASHRHFMVVKGHYLRYIERYFEEPNNVTLLGFRKRDTGELFGFTGFEVFQNKAQITLMKHRGGDEYFPRYFWLTTVQHILGLGVARVQCGTTAEFLKDTMRFSYDMSVKVDMKAFNVAVEDKGGFFK